MGTAIAAVVLAIVSFLLLFVNPWNLGVSTSVNFSVSGFEQTAAGEPIGSVIERLGPPLGVSDRWNDGGSRVRTYTFAGEPTAAWVVAYRKAWVLVKEEDDTVKRIHWYVEP